jgi:hypothetical protein
MASLSDGSGKKARRVSSGKDSIVPPLTRAQCEWLPESVKPLLRDSQGH